MFHSLFEIWYIPCAVIIQFGCFSIFDLRAEFHFHHYKCCVLCELRVSHFIYFDSPSSESFMKCQQFMNIALYCWFILWFHFYLQFAEYVQCSSWCIKFMFAQWTRYSFQWLEEVLNWLSVKWELIGVTYLHVVYGLRLLFSFYSISSHLISVLTLVSYDLFAIVKTNGNDFVR